MFHPATLVQHYLRPEEMRPFYQQALEHARRAAAAAPGGSGGGAAAPAPAGASGSGGAAGGGGSGGDPAGALYAQLVSMGLLRR